MATTFWPEFIVFFIASLLGGAAILPYGLKLLKMSTNDKPLKYSVAKLAWLSLLQNAVLSAIVVGIGLLASRALGHGAPYVESWILHSTTPASAHPLNLAIFIGVLTGIFFLLFDFGFLSRLPTPLLETTRQTTALQNLAASFYGGINEELLTRWFGLSATAWLLTKAVGHATNTIFWTANILMAVLFGLGHLPTTKKLVGKITPFLLFRALLLNGVIGLACGWLFWNYGLESAMLAHFSADIIYHVGGVFVFKLHGHA